MKKIFFIFLVLSVFIGASLYATTPISDGDSSVLKISPVADITAQGVLDKDYKASDPFNFQVKAYKKTPRPVLMTLFDAFSRNLDEVVDNSEVDVYSKLSAFLYAPPPEIGPNGKPKPLTGKEPLAIVNDKNQVIFSFLVTGAEYGTYTLSMDFSAFYGPGVDVTTHRIDSYYQVFDYKVRFPKSPDPLVSKNGLYSIINPEKVYTKQSADDTHAKIDVKWTVKYGGDSASTPVPMGEFWSAEGAVSMAIRKVGDNGYDSDINPSGRYESKVTVTIART